MQQLARASSSPLAQLLQTSSVLCPRISVPLLSVRFKGEWRWSALPLSVHPRSCRMPASHPTLKPASNPQLPDPATVFKLQAGVKPPKLPDTCSQLKLEPGMKPKLLEPKPEPCEDTTADDWEITPVSGNHPFFTTVLSRTQVQKSFQLTIPTRFQRHLPEARVPAVLLCRGRSWTTSYCGDLKCKKLDTAWRDFAVDNRLRVGDACVFELMGGEAEAEAGNCDKKVVFRVQVLRGGLPEEVTSKGATADEPLVIVG